MDLRRARFGPCRALDHAAAANTTRQQWTRARATPRATRISAAGGVRHRGLVCGTGRAIRGRSRRFVACGRRSASSRRHRCRARQLSRSSRRAARLCASAAPAWHAAARPWTARRGEQAFAAALEAAPLYVEARVALARIYCDDGRTGPAVDLCQVGLAAQPNEAPLWRGLGLARLAQRRGRLARQAFKQAIALDPTDAETHYNNGVALQLMHQRDAALRSYQRALALKPDFLAADFNIGVIFREQGHWDAAVNAFRDVLTRDPRHVPAYKALAETLVSARRLDEWFKAFDRFEVACLDALPLCVVALEVYQYRGDFASIDHYL